MNKETLSRIWQTGWLNFKRNSYVSFGTTGVMVLVLLLFTGLLSVNFLSNNIVSTIEEKVDITAYFKIEATDLEINQVQSDIAAMDEVVLVEYISRDQALEDFRKAHAGDSLIQESLAELGSNPLQASLNIKATNSRHYVDIVESLEANKFRTLIDKINFYENEQVINRVQSISNGLQTWGFVATLALAVVAVLVTFNTIRLTIYNQKQEIEIMKLVGGSNWFIKAPFMVEGALYGVFAAFVALALFYPTSYIVSPKIEALIPGVKLFAYFIQNSYQFVPLIFGVGIILGVASSMIAVRRFLKV